MSNGNLASSLSRADGWWYYGAFVQDDFRIRANADLESWPALRRDHGADRSLRSLLELQSDGSQSGDRHSRRAAVCGRRLRPSRSTTRTTTTSVRALASAWDIAGDGRTVLRAGYGIFYYHSAVFEYPDTQGFSVDDAIPVTTGRRFPGIPAGGRAATDYPAVRKLVGAEQFPGQQRDLLREGPSDADGAAVEPDRATTVAGGRRSLKRPTPAATGRTSSVTATTSTSSILSTIPSAWRSTNACPIRSSALSRRERRSADRQSRDVRRSVRIHSI